MVRPVKASLYRNYLIKAQQLLATGRYALNARAYNAAVVNAVHAAINALDVLTVFHEEKRASGAHEDILSLVKAIVPAQEYTPLARQFTGLIEQKNAAEYQPDLLTHDDAKHAVA